MIFPRNDPKSLAFVDRRLRAAFENGLLTSAGRHRRERETLGRFSTRADGSFRTPNATGSEPRLSESGASVANPAKKGGKRRKPRGLLSAFSVNSCVPGTRTQTNQLPVRNTPRNNSRRVYLAKCLKSLGFKCSRPLGRSQTRATFHGIRQIGLTGHAHRAVTSRSHCVPRKPNLNDFAERFVQSIKIECLDHFVCFGEGHLRHIVAKYLEFYNRHRPHQGRNNRILPGADAEDSATTCRWRSPSPPSAAMARRRRCATAGSASSATAATRC